MEKQWEIVKGWYPSAEGGDGGWYALEREGELLALISCDDEDTLKEIAHRLRAVLSVESSESE